MIKWNYSPAIDTRSSSGCLSWSGIDSGFRPDICKNDTSQKVNNRRTILQLDQTHFRQFNLLFSHYSLQPTADVLLLEKSQESSAAVFIHLRANFLHLQSSCIQTEEVQTVFYFIFFPPQHHPVLIHAGEVRQMPPGLLKRRANRELCRCRGQFLSLSSAQLRPLSPPTSITSLRLSSLFIYTSACSPSSLHPPPPLSLSLSLSIAQ